MVLIEVAVAIHNKRREGEEMGMSEKERKERKKEKQMIGGYARGVEATGAWIGLGGRRRNVVWLVLEEVVLEQGRVREDDGGQGWHGLGIVVEKLHQPRQNRCFVEVLFQFFCSTKIEKKKKKFNPKKKKGGGKKGQNMFSPKQEREREKRD
jgi:hypothetical protein